MISSPMNDGVALLLERMKTYPEEFVPNNGSSKWGSLIAAYKEFLEPEDRQALIMGVNKLLQQAFTEKVMQELIDPKPKLTRDLRIPLAGSTPIQYTADKLEALGQTPIAGVTQTL